MPYHTHTLHSTLYTHYIHYTIHLHRERELVSQLLSQGYPNLFSTNIVGKGFERLFEIVDEVELDAPAAREILSKYLARCVIDEILPPSFLTDAVIANLGGDIVEATKRMLSQSHAG